MSDAIFYILLSLAFAYTAVLFYYWIALLKVKKHIAPENITNPIFISVIVPARNEEANISNLLESLRNQNYDPGYYEVIVVNDHSTDRTVEEVSGYLNEQIKLIHLADYIKDTAFIAFKKKAIEAGISIARGELIVTTDADCVVPESWLHTIAGYYATHKPVFIAMPVCIHPAKTILQRFQSLDFTMLQAITASAVSNNIHSMCNGANLAYTKEAFHEAGGFAGIDGIASGDDMLLMEKMKERYPNKIGYLFSKDVIVKTKPVNTVREFLQQRIRWAGKSGLYKEKGILPVMFLVYFYNLFLVVGAALCINHQLSLSFLFSLLCIKMITELLLIWPISRFFNAQRQLWMFPFFQPAHILYTVMAGSFGMLRSYEWKGRQTN